MEGRVVRIDDFLVTLELADGSTRTFRRDGDVPKVEVHDPLKGSSRSAVRLHGRGHARRDRLSGDLEMNSETSDCSAAVADVDASAGAGRRSHSGGIAEAAEGFLADVQRRLLGKRYSALTQVNTSNVRNLTLAWMIRLTPGPGNPAAAGDPAAAAEAVRPRSSLEAKARATLWSEAERSRRRCLRWMARCISRCRTTPGLWMRAMDANCGITTGRRKGGTHIGNRGLGMWNGYLYMETPDNYLVSLDAKTGKERWHKPIADLSQGYFSTPAPIVVGNHVIVGTGNDIDAPGFLQSFDPETGELQWKLYTVPMKKGDPGLDTWASLDAARHGGAQTWIPGAYDPETQVVHLRHGQSDAGVYDGQARRRRQSVHLRAGGRECRYRARWPGISRPRRTTCTTTIRRRRLCWWMACSTASRESWC